MLIEKVISQGEVLTAEQLVKVTGGTGGSMGENINRHTSCSCTGAGDNTNEANGCSCDSSSLEHYQQNSDDKAEQQP